MPDDLRHRYAEALAAKFTYPVYRCDKDGENEWVENPEPADRVEQTPYVMVSAGDGNRSFWTPTCTELGEVVAAVRDEELETARAAVLEYENTITWFTTCKGCAATLDSSYAETVRAEKAEAALAALTERVQTRDHLTDREQELSRLRLAHLGAELEAARRELAEATATLTELAPAKDRSDEDRLRRERNEWMARAESAEEALHSSRTALDRVIALARTLADTDSKMADLIAETVVNMPGECKPGAALAALTVENGREAGETP